MQGHLRAFCILLYEQLSYVFQYCGYSGSVFELHCDTACLLAWLQGQDSNPGAIVGIQCLVKGHLFSCREPFEVHRHGPGSSGQEFRAREKDSCEKIKCHGLFILCRWHCISP